MGLGLLVVSFFFLFLFFLINILQKKDAAVEQILRIKSENKGVFGYRLFC